MTEFLAQIIAYFNPVTTLLIVTLLITMRKRIVQRLKNWTISVTEGVLYYAGHMVQHEIAAALSLKKYCRMQLSEVTYQYLRIPSREDVPIDIDRIFVPLVLENPGERAEHTLHSQLLSLG